MLESRGHERVEDICGLVRDNFQEAFRRDLRVRSTFLQGRHLDGWCIGLCALSDVVVNPNEVRTGLRLPTLGAGFLPTRKPVGTTHVAANVPASRQV